MTQDDTIRWGWLKEMYIYTIFGAGGFGLGIILMPKVMISIFSWPSQDPIVFGITGSVFHTKVTPSPLCGRGPGRGDN